MGFFLKGNDGSLELRGIEFQTLLRCSVQKEVLLEASVDEVFLLLVVLELFGHIYCCFLKRCHIFEALCFSDVFCHYNSPFSH